MKRITAVSIYAIAMGYLEAAVVIYLRLMEFGDPAHVFPMKLLGSQTGIIELGREIVTIVMLGVIGLLAGKSRLQKCMYFIFSFAIWDLTYYIFLRMLTGWPPSLFSFDVLFLVPVVWIGPVAAPILIAILLLVFSSSMILISERNLELKIGIGNISIFGLSCIIILFSFTREIFHILLSDGPKGLDNYSPRSFEWMTFGVGFVLMCFSAGKIVMDSYQKWYPKR
ncbi:MAG TPA: hypothetical protein VIS48_01205 [Candidatus Kryptonia bacterium]